MKGYRTILWNVGNAIVPAMQAASSSYKIPDEWMPYWLAAYIIGNVILRMDTTTAIGKSS